MHYISYCLPAVILSDSIATPHPFIDKQEIWANAHETHESL